MNALASQSSSSGWVGFSPFLPKSEGVPTIPLPKWYCQTRLTNTRAVNGLDGVARARAPSFARYVGPGIAVDRYGNLVLHRKAIVEARDLCSVAAPYNAID